MINKTIFFLLTLFLSTLYASAATISQEVAMQKAIAFLSLKGQRALTFTGADWDDWWREFRGGVSPLYGDNYYDAVYGNSYFTKANYCSYLQNSTYEFIQLASHSNVQVHNFPTTAANAIQEHLIRIANTYGYTNQILIPKQMRICYCPYTPIQ